VGKSVLFGHLTGLHVAVANYAGTTVELARGRGVFGGQEAAILDLPGIYTLSATNEAEQVATEILSCPAELVLVVADALFLEASLYLTQQVIDLNNPVVVILNRVDVARERGIAIDAERLARELGVPVVPTVAVRGEGLAQLDQVVAGQLREPPHRPSTGPVFATHEPGSGGIVETARAPGAAPEDHRWRRVEEIVRRVELRGDTKKSRWSRLAGQLIRPWPGLPVALLVLAIAFGAIIGLGMGVRQFLLLPVARGYLFPALRSGVSVLIAPGFFRNILIGEYGFLIKGIEWPFTLVLPYVVSFYLVISILEDSGYLPRLAVLLDGLLSRLGLRGSHTISLLLGYGCAIPGILSARAMGSHKERIILATLISLAVPCISQTGAIFALLAEGALVLVPALFLLSLLVMIVAGAVMDRLLPGTRSQVVFEMPVLLRPQFPVILRKLRGQVVHYLYDGALPMVAAVGVAAILYETGVLVVLARLLAPLVTGWLRLPAEAAVPLVLGVVRRELTVLPLLEMDLSSLQLFVGATVGLFYLPCIAVMATLNREFGPRVALRLLLLTTGVAFLLGGIIAQTGRLVGAV
jgi:ferrous iron transport protein B